MSLSKQNFAIDTSLSLLNRTGAFYLTEDLKNALEGYWGAMRCWRSHRPRNYTRVERKLRASAMLHELRLPCAGTLLPSWPRRDGLRYLHMDPLYVLNDALRSDDRVLCHDIGPISHPELYEPTTLKLYERAFRKIASVRPSMTFVSEASQRAFVSAYGSEFPSLDVIPLYLRAGLRQETSRPSGPLRPAELRDIEAPFFLSVGEVGLRKAQLETVAGFVASGLVEKGFNYVICGPDGFGAEPVNEAIQNAPGVRRLNYVSDHALNWLYKHAAFFLLLSKLEGFGLPAIEASMRGLLPVISDDPALVEVTGGQAEIVDSTDPRIVGKRLRTIAKMPEKQKIEKLERIQLHAQRYTFHRFIENWKVCIASAKTGTRGE